MDWAAMTLGDRIPRIQRCRTRFMVNARKHSTEHTWNMLSIVGIGRIAQLATMGKRRIRRPISRVLCHPGQGEPRRRMRRPFLWTGPCGTVLATNPDASGQRRPYRLAPARNPYSVLLLAGLAVPSTSPPTRCALTAPFHPYPSGEGRFAFCGAIPGVAPGGRYPPPCRRGARTFLDRKCGRGRPAV